MPRSLYHDAMTFDEKGSNEACVSRRTQTYQRACNGFIAGIQLSHGLTHILMVAEDTSFVVARRLHRISYFRIVRSH